MLAFQVCGSHTTSLFHDYANVMEMEYHIHGNEITLKFMHHLTSKPILGDTGYGVAGHTESKCRVLFTILYV